MPTKKPEPVDLEFTDADLKSEDFVVRIRGTEYRIPGMDEFSFAQMRTIQSSTDTGDPWEAMEAILSGADAETVEAIMNLPARHALRVLHGWMNMGGGEPGESGESSPSSEDTDAQ